MSYNVDSPCEGCNLSPSCSDGKIIRGAIDTIHQIGHDGGHKGGGTVTHTCSYKVDTIASSQEGSSGCASGGADGQ